ncbi:hypothetical protein [Rhodoplanes elegans]|uniref:hypothetical protein n=1 Tax=Rhodoplanes elegans TaxID=29408 RepID=UPI0011B93E47|nr:hypothetical protein [Rhodoplanes elegans]
MTLSLAAKIGGKASAALELLGLMDLAGRIVMADALQSQFQTPAIPKCLKTGTSQERLIIKAACVDLHPVA